MSWFLVFVRRLLWLLLIAAVGGVAYSWWRDRSGAEPSGPAEWPPLPARRPDAAGTTSAPTTVGASTDATDAPSTEDQAARAGSWIPAASDGSCPVSHPIKANDKSGIFHVPEGRFYERTKAQRCYQSADAAVADGYRQAKS